MSGERAPESPGVENRVVALSVAGIFSAVPVAAVAVWLLYPSVHSEPIPAVDPFPAPSLEIHPVASYAAYLTAQRARLAGADGRIPIEEAMTRVAVRGADAYGPVIPPGGAPPAIPATAPEIGPDLPSEDRP